MAYFCSILSALGEFLSVAFSSFTNCPSLKALELPFCMPVARCNCADHLCRLSRPRWTRLTICKFVHQHQIAYTQRIEVKVHRHHSLLPGELSKNFKEAAALVLCICHRRLVIFSGNMRKEYVCLVSIFGPTLAIWNINHLYNFGATLASLVASDLFFFLPDESWSRQIKNGKSPRIMVDPNRWYATGLIDGREIRFFLLALTDVHDVFVFEL